ncbi:hypothetical protein [Methylosinus sp. PW1]|uniref:hypothetical protein n=1 Tax=Methylosinus sp. PW1 TaxID=107636 RepID=UPI000566486C|nr:hypothetical protein [Methylosinus sp. PW1]
MESDLRPGDAARRQELRASLRVLRSESADASASAPPRIMAPRRLVVVAPRPAADEPLPPAQRILASAALAGLLLMAVAALSDAAAHAMDAMEPRAIASLEMGRPHFGFGQ